LKGVKDVLKRGEGHRRTASTGWNERSSRNRVFRLVIESRERDPECRMDKNGSVPPTPE
jgi:centromeric protein E